MKSTPALFSGATVYVDNVVHMILYKFTRFLAPHVLQERIYPLVI